MLEKALENCRGIASFSGNESASDDEDVVVHRDGITLDTDVEAKGENFSHGQRQVLSLCRALIRKSKLMLLDEATASMDYETDRGIQQVLRNELEEAGGDRTLVTIAHRLRTIIDYDTVVVMGAGRVVEYVFTPATCADLKYQHANKIIIDAVHHETCTTPRESSTTWSIIVARWRSWRACLVPKTVARPQRDHCRPQHRLNKSVLYTTAYIVIYLAQDCIDKIVGFVSFMID